MTILRTIESRPAEKGQKVNDSFSGSLTALNPNRRGAGGLPTISRPPISPHQNPRLPPRGFDLGSERGGGIEGVHTVHLDVCPIPSLFFCLVGSLFPLLPLLVSAGGVGRRPEPQSRRAMAAGNMASPKPHPRTQILRSANPLRNPPVRARHHTRDTSIGQRGTTGKSSWEGDSRHSTCGPAA